MFSYSEFKQDTSNIFFEHRIPQSEDYKVVVNGREVPVYQCRISAYPFNRIWQGVQRTVDQTEVASYVNLISDEEIKVEVIPQKSDYKKIMIKPYSKGVEASVENGKICFTLKENGGYVLELDDYHHCLYIFNNRPVVLDTTETVTYYFGAGIHFPGKIKLKSGESVYVDKDAYVYGCIYAENAENIRIFGNGIFDDSAEERTSRNMYENYVNGNLRFYDCNNVLIQGVGFTNSAIWCLSLYHCIDVDINAVNVFGQWRYNTDGVDIVNCQNTVLRNSFVHSFDDAVTIKGIDRYQLANNKNILIENCTLWCDWGRACEIGIETACREYSNIVFRNCDILRGGAAALDIQNGDFSEIHNVLFEDIRIEYEAFYTPEVYQSYDDMKYEEQNGTAKTWLFKISNHYYRGEVQPKTEVKGITGGLVHDVILRDIKVYYDNALPCKDGKYETFIGVRSMRENVEHYNVFLENIFINGKRVGQKDICCEIGEVKNFRF